MGKKKRIVGTGITAREADIYDGEDIGPAFRRMAEGWSEAVAEAGGAFAATTAEMIAEVHAVRPPGDRSPYLPDSPEDFAQKIGRRHQLALAGIRRGNADEAARYAFEAGFLYAQAAMKEAWEAHALRGAKNASILVPAAQAENRRRQAAASERWEPYQRAADEIWSRHPEWCNTDVARRLAKDLGGKPDTIRRNIRQKLPE